MNVRVGSVWQAREKRMPDATLAWALPRLYDVPKGSSENVERMLDGETFVVVSERIFNVGEQFYWVVTERGTKRVCFRSWFRPQSLVEVTP